MSRRLLSDPIRFEVTKNALSSISGGMSAALQRAAYSTNIKTRLDFSCAIFDSRLRVLAQALAQPSHLGSLPQSVPSAVREYGLQNLHPGDGLVFNDPHRGSVPRISILTTQQESWGSVECIDL